MMQQTARSKNSRMQGVSVGLKSKRQDEFFIALDEFEREDIFLLGSLMVSKNQREVLERKWRKLQLKIKGALFERNEQIRNDPRLAGDLLPEIHAVWLCQSTGYYRWKNPPRQDYWKEHLGWLEEAASIIKHVSPLTMLQPYGEGLPIFNAIVKGIEDGFFYNEDTTEHEKRDSEKIARILSNKYANILPHFLAYSDAYLSKMGRHAQLICDNFEDCKGFSHLTIYESIQSSGHLKNISRPVFLDSAQEPLIQAADVVSYIGGQRVYTTEMARIGKSIQQNYRNKALERMYFKYIYPLNEHTRVEDAVIENIGVHNNIARILFGSYIQSQLSKKGIMQVQWEATIDQMVRDLSNRTTKMSQSGIPVKVAAPSGE